LRFAGGNKAKTVISAEYVRYRAAVVYLQNKSDGFIFYPQKGTRG